MVFFIYSNILESRVINLRGQDSLKIQKFIQRNSKIAIAIYLCNIYLDNEIFYLILYQLQVYQGELILYQGGMV